jgi:EmrB/QacA subfamily drug resistance transporter
VTPVPPAHLARLTLAAVVAAVFLGALDQTVIVTVLPAVVTDLQIPFDHLDQAAWVVSGYLLGYTVALPLVGRVADVHGRRPSWLFALGGFSLGSLGCALAPTLAALVVARLVQAAGGGALLPVAIAIVSDRWPDGRRALAIGIIGAVAEAGGVLGPLYGAAVVQWLSWRWIFWINLPVALVLLAIAFLGLREAPRPGGHLDLVGAALIALSLGLLLLGLSHEPVGLSGLDLRPVLLLAAASGGVGFGWWEARIREPLLDFRLFRTPAFAVAVGGGLLLGVGLIAAMVDVPLYAATVLNASPADGGLLLMRLTAFIPVGALLGGALGQRLRLGYPTGLGFLLVAVGLAAMSQWGIAPGPTALWLSLGLTGLGFGLLIAPLSTAAVNAAGAFHEASGASLFTVARLVGMTVGLSVLTTWGLQRFDDLAGRLPLPLPQPGDTAAVAQARVAAYNLALLRAGAAVYHEIFLAAAVLCLFGLAAAAMLLQAPGGGKAPS